MTNGKGDTGKGDPGQGDLSKRSTRASVAAQQEAAPNHVQVEHESFENFVRGQFSSLAAKMDSILAGQAALEKRCEAIESRVDSNTQQSSDIIRSLNFESERINEHEAELADLKQVVKELRIKSQQDTSIITSLTSDMSGLQRYTRSFNVRILGMPEEKDENCVESVERLFVEHFDVPNGSIENAHRVGKSDAGKPRQMIARFHSRATRRDVMVAARETLANTGLRVIDDLTQKDLETKRRVLPLMEKLYTENKKPRFANGRLFSNGKPVPQATIDAFLAQT